MFLFTIIIVAMLNAVCITEFRHFPFRSNLFNMILLFIAIWFINIINYSEIIWYQFIINIQWEIRE